MESILRLAKDWRFWVLLIVLVAAFAVVQQNYELAVKVAKRVAHRVTADNVHHIIAAIAWPAVVVVSVLLFRNPLAYLVAALKEVKPMGDSGPSFAFDHRRTCENKGDTAPTLVSVKTLEAAPAAQAAAGAPAKPALDPAKLGHVYWVGADLTSLVWHLTTGGDRDKIHFYLRQANSHMRRAGLAGSPVQQVMQRLYDEGRKKITGDWTPNLRRQYAQDAHKLIQAVAAIAEAQQGPSFVGEVADDE